MEQIPRDQFFRLPFAFYDGIIKEGDELTLGDEEAHHLSKVLRLWQGNTVILTNGRHRGFLAHIEAIKKNSVSILIDRELKLPEPPKYYVSLAVGIPLGNIMDDIIHHATELGAHSIIPLVTELTQAPKRLANADRIERWRRIAKEAMKQCQRFHLPEVKKAIKLADLLNDLPDYNLVCIGEPGGKAPKVAFEQIESERILLIIGPEGGLTKQEVDLLKQNKAKCIDLGPRRLKVDTAALTILALLNSNLERWGTH